MRMRDVLFGILCITQGMKDVLLIENTDLWYINEEKGYIIKILCKVFFSLFRVSEQGYYFI